MTAMYIYSWPRYIYTARITLLRAPELLSRLNAKPITSPGQKEGHFCHWGLGNRPSVGKQAGHLHPFMEMALAHVVKKTGVTPSSNPSLGRGRRGPLLLLELE